MKKLINSIILFSGILFGCQKDEPTASIFKGVEQSLGNGKAYSWVKFNADNTPSSIGVTLTKGALDNLNHSGMNLILSLPSEAVGKTPFDHLMLDYLHTGHEPMGVYDLAHFDVHFYTQALEERKAIPPYMPTTATKFDNLPADGMIPKPYIRLPAGVPLMGVHWANPTSPELAAKAKFTETFVYGSYDGKLTFLEPMLSYDFLKSSPNVTKDIPTPTKFAKAGYFPMKYSIKQVGDEILISLDEMMMMQ